MLLNRKLLAKILAMTTSDNDGEALNAVRMANTMVTEAGETWEKVLGSGLQRPVTVTVTRHAAPEQRQQAEDWIAPHLKDKVTIDMMFRAIYDMPSGDPDFWQHIDGIHQSWKDYGAVSQRHYTDLRGVYQKLTASAASPK